MAKKGKRAKGNTAGTPRLERAVANAYIADILASGRRDAPAVPSYFGPQLEAAQEATTSANVERAKRRLARVIADPGSAPQEKLAAALQLELIEQPNPETVDRLNRALRTPYQGPRATPSVQQAVEGILERLETADLGERVALQERYGERLATVARELAAYKKATPQEQRKMQWAMAEGGGPDWLGIPRRERKLAGRAAGSKPAGAAWYLQNTIQHRRAEPGVVAAAEKARRDIQKARDPVEVLRLVRRELEEPVAVHYKDLSSEGARLEVQESATGAAPKVLEVRNATWRKRPAEDVRAGVAYAAQKLGLPDEVAEQVMAEKPRTSKGTATFGAFFSTQKGYPYNPSKEVPRLPINIPLDKAIAEVLNRSGKPVDMEAVDAAFQDLVARGKLAPEAVEELKERVVRQVKQAHSKLKPAAVVAPNRPTATPPPVNPPGLGGTMSKEGRKLLPLLPTPVDQPSSREQRLARIKGRKQMQSLEAARRAKARGGPIVTPGSPPLPPFPRDYIASRGGTWKKAGAGFQGTERRGLLLPAATRPPLMLPPPPTRPERPSWNAAGKAARIEANRARMAARQGAGTTGPIATEGAPFMPLARVSRAAPSVPAGRGLLRQALPGIALAVGLELPDLISRLRGTEEKQLRRQALRELLVARETRPTYEDVRRQLRIKELVNERAQLLQENDPALAMILMGMPSTVQGEVAVGAQPNPDRMRRFIQGEMQMSGEMEALLSGAGNAD